MKTDIDFHIHPYIGKHSVADIAWAMTETDVGIVAVEVLDDSCFPRVVEETKRYFPGSVIDRAGVQLPDGRFILNAREYNTKEGFHLLTVGHSVDSVPSTPIRSVIEVALDNDALVILDHPYVDNHRYRTAAHISQEKEAELEQICRDYSGQVALEWNAYCIPWIRWGLKTALNCVGAGIRYHDVNKRVERLSERLLDEGYNVPVIADTDLHGRKRDFLLHMGRSRIVTDIQGESPAEVVCSMRKNIFQGDYQNMKQYVSSWHFFRAFGVPVLFPSVHKRPRA